MRSMQSHSHSWTLQDSILAACMTQKFDVSFAALLSMAGCFIRTNSSVQSGLCSCWALSKHSIHAPPQTGLAEGTLT